MGQVAEPIILKGLEKLLEYLAKAGASAAVTAVVEEVFSEYASEEYKISSEEKAIDIALSLVIGPVVRVDDNYRRVILVNRVKESDEPLESDITDSNSYIKTLPDAHNGYMAKVQCPGIKTEGEAEGEDEERKVNPNGLTEEEEDAINDVLKGSEKGESTKGPTDQRKKSGGQNQADEDFDSIPLTEEKPISTQYGPGRTGKLSNGRSVTVRPGSSEGSPTLQIPEGASRWIKIRYF